MKARRSPFFPLPEIPPAPGRALAEILEGGQTFLWSEDADGAFTGVFGKIASRLRADDAGRLSFSCINNEDTESVRAALIRFLGGDAHARAISALAKLKDPRLAVAMAAFPGLRVLRQPFADALITFICSANANIPRIRTMVRAIAREFGPRVGPGLHALPDWKKLSRADLSVCRLGYREPFLRDTARFLAKHPDFEDNLSRLPGDEARRALMTLPGVGPKVADCVRLFGLGHADAFPVDTWIRRIMETRHDLAGRTNAEIADFARGRYGPHAGLAQQFLFSHARLHPSRD